MRGIGGGGEREHVDFAAQGFQPLFLPHAESMFLVDDDEAESLEADVGLQELVGADDHIDAALAQGLDHRVSLSARAESRELLDAHRPRREAVRESLMVLLGEQRGGHEDCDLTVVLDGDERRSHRDLGLSETHVAADQALHRLFARHVRDHRLYRRLLVRGLLEWELPFEDTQLAAVELEGMPAPGGAASEDVEQLRRYVECFLRRFAARPRPLLPSQAVQRGELRVDTRVAAHQVKGGDRNVELVAPFVLEVEVLARDAAHVESQESPIPAHAVVFVNDRGTRRKFREVAHEGVGVPVASPATPPLHGPFAEELRLGDDSDGRIPQPGAFLERRDGDCEPRFSFEKAPPVVEIRRTQTAAGERVPQVFAPSRALRHQQSASLEFGEETLEGGKGFPCLRVDGHAHRDAGVVGGEAASRFLLEAPEPNLRIIFQPRECLVDGQKQLGRLEEGALPIVAPVLESLMHLIPEALGGVVHVLEEDDQGIFRKVVEQRRRKFEKERQVVLDAGRAASLAHLSVYGALLGISLEARPPRAPKAPDGGLRQRKLPCRQKSHAVQALGGALGLRIEGADAVHFVVQQIDSQRMRRTARKEIQEGSTHRELAVIHHLPDAAIPESLQAGPRRVEVQPLARRQHHAAAVDELGRREPSHQGGDRNDQGAAAARRQPVQGDQALGYDVLVGREQVVGQGLPVGKVEDLSTVGTEKETKLGLEPVGRGRVGHRHQHQAGVAAHRFGDRDRTSGAVQVAPPDPPSGSRRQDRFEW